MPDFFKRTESMGTGYPPSPQEAAPAYEDAIHLHGSGYAVVPQIDVEHEAPTHNHSTPAEPGPSQPPETLAQTIAGVLRPKPHVHCEECDKQTERRERRANERHCCSMVAWVFILLIVCGMLLGIVIANTAAKRARHHD